jgi:RNA polymerase sigma-70 factor, ECF subfamily
LRTLDSHAFAEQFQSCSHLLWCIAAGVTGRRRDAEDIVQEAASIALTKLAEFDASTSFAAWMGQIVRNVARNARRQNIRRRTDATDPEQMDHLRASNHSPTTPLSRSAVGDLADDQGGQGLFDDAVLAALQDLDEIPRVCLLLRTLHETPYRDLSHLLGIPEGTAMSHVHRARHLLRQRLASHPAAPRAPVAEGGAA